MTVVVSKQSMLESDGGIKSRLTATFLNGRVDVTATKILEAYPERLHYHENAHLNFILNGGVVDRRRTGEAERRSGDLMFFHAGEPHQTLYKLLPQINLSLEIDDRFFADRSFGGICLLEDLSKNLNTKFLAVRIYKELLTSDEFSTSSIEMLLLSLFSSEAAKSRPRWLDKVIELLKDNWNEPISLRDLANAANVYPTTVSKHFPKYVSCTLGEYRRRLKVEKSLRLINNSDKSLTQIAYECGFSDQSHFTRTFKQLTGFLPRQYEKL